VDPAPLSFLDRLWFAWVCFFRVLFDGAFAGRAFAVREAMPALPAPEPPPSANAAKESDRSSAPDNDESAAEEAEESPPEEVGKTVRVKVKKRRPEHDTLADAPVSKARAALAAEAALAAQKAVMPALQLLAAFQREGRLVDFLEQDVATFSDADVGAAARVVHEGCRKALRQHAQIEAVRSEEEGSAITIPEGYDAQSVKLIGDVQGKPPYKGKLQHKGWRVKEMSLPEPTKDHDARVIAPAEVEL